MTTGRMAQVSMTSQNTCSLLRLARLVVLHRLRRLLLLRLVRQLVHQVLRLVRPLPRLQLRVRVPLRPLLHKAVVLSGLGNSSEPFN